MPVSPDLQRQLARLRRLSQNDDVWEGAIVAMPMWVEGEEEPYRPRAAVWVSATGRPAHTSQLKAPGEEAGPSEVIAALCEMALSQKLVGERPRALHVRDAALAEMLRDALAGQNIDVALADELPALQQFVSESAAAMSEDSVPGALTAPGVTIERLRAFADAAKTFFEAAPWRHLGDGDLISIETPKSGRGLDLLAVMGSAGLEHGLGFFSSEQKYREMMQGAAVNELHDLGADWAIYLSPGWEIPVVDLDAWDRFALPLAGPHAYPFAMRLDLHREPQRPDAGRLAHFEGLLRALAATTEAEMDSGRWSHTVTTAEGERTYTLTLPDLLEPPAKGPATDGRAFERIQVEIERQLRTRQFESDDEVNRVLEDTFAGRSIDDVPSSAATPLERAQDLIYEAFETRGRRQLHLIRQALALSTDCADAYLLLSERSSSNLEIGSLLEQAVAAGERALGPDAFTNPKVSFWGDVGTRPFMRAKSALANFLAATGNMDAAIRHYRDLLTVNPGDNQGNRYQLMTALLITDRNAEAEALFTWIDDAGALWLYHGVLLAFRAGDRKLARKRLRAALKSNRHVPAFLTGRRELPDEGPQSFQPGARDEAVIYALEAIEEWEATPGAVAWLRAETRA